MNNDKGITLIELLVVITIIAILVIALGFSFQGWIGGYNIESQAKEMYVDLMNARARAMERNRMHFVTFPTATSYSTYEDTNPGPDGNGNLDDPGDTLLPSFPKTVGYALNVSLVGGGTTITFNTRGLVSPNGNIQFSLPTNVSPDYDCIVLFPTRINIGKWNVNTSSCDAK